MVIGEGGIWWGSQLAASYIITCEQFSRPAFMWPYLELLEMPHAPF